MREVSKNVVEEEQRSNKNVWLKKIKIKFPKEIIFLELCAVAVFSFYERQLKNSHI